MVGKKFLDQRSLLLEPLDTNLFTHDPCPLIVTPAEEHLQERPNNLQGHHRILVPLEEVRELDADATVLQLLNVNAIGTAVARNGRAQRDHYTQTDILALLHITEELRDLS